MHFIQDKNKFLGLSPAVLGGMATLTIALFFSCQTNAQSQNQALMDHTHPNVTVDLSVISGGATNQPASLGSGILPSASNYKLLRPGIQTPRSMLHVPAANGSSLLQAKRNVNVKPASKSMLHVPPPNLTSTLQTENKVKAVTAPKKTQVKQTKIKNIAVVKSAKKSPPPAAKVASPKKAVSHTPKTTTKAPKKLQAQTSQRITKPTSVTVNEVKQTAPPSAPSIKAAPKIAKMVTPVPPTALVVKKERPKQQASLPPTNLLGIDAKELRVSFAQNQTKLPASAKKPLVSLAESLKGTVNKRVQLMAYAGGPSLSSSHARRMSLSRALAIRSFLIENGVRSTRIDVRALGNKTTEEPLNRVDLKITER
jgi:outer membrane protein OmpA-like peptidoglycan-associated protein